MTQCENCLHKKICDLWEEIDGADAGCYSLGDTCYYFDGWIPAEGYTPEENKYYIIRYIYPGFDHPFYCLMKWQGIVPDVIQITNFMPVDIIEPQFLAGCADEATTFKEDTRNRVKDMLESRNKPTTNADRIRAMCDEELAEIYNGCPHPDPGEKCRGIKCNDCILEWLQQPAEVT